MIFGAVRGRGLRPSWDAAASSRLRTSFFSRSLQRRPQIHRQQARPHPDFRGLFSFIPDAGQAEVLFAVSEGAFDPIPFFLFLLKPSIRTRRRRPPAQRFERRPYAQRFQVRPVDPRSVFRVPYKVRRELSKSFPIGFQVPSHVLRFVKRFMFPVIQEQESVHVRQRPPRSEFRLLPVLSRLDRPHIRPIQTDDPVGDPVHFFLMHLPLLAKNLLRHREPFQDFLLHLADVREKSPQLDDIPPHILQHRLLRSVDDLLGLPLGLGEPEIILLRFPSPHLSAQFPDRPNEPPPDVVQKSDIGRELDLLRKDRRIGQHPLGLDDPPFDQHRVGLFLQLLEKLRPEALAHPGQRARVRGGRRGHRVKPAKRLHVGILHDLGDDLPVAELGHVFEQKKSEDQLGVLGWPAGVGKVLEIFELELLPGNKNRDAKPAIPLIEASAEGKEFGEKNLGFTVFGFVHVADLRGKVHGFRWGEREKRASGALNRSAVCHIIILMSIAYMELGGFSADPNYGKSPKICLLLSNPSGAG